MTLSYESHVEHTHTHTHTYTAANVYAFDPSALYFVTKLMLNYVLSQTLH